MGDIAPVVVPEVVDLCLCMTSYGWGCRMPIDGPLRYFCSDCGKRVEIQKAVDWSKGNFHA